MNRLATLLAAVLLCACPAYADIAPMGRPKTPSKVPPKPLPPSAQPAPAPTPASNSREPVVVARQNPAIAELLKQARAGGSADAPANPKIPTTDEIVTQVPLGGQCGFAGCSSSTLVAFTYRTRGANPATNSVLVLVSCEAVHNIPCIAVQAEVRGTSSPNPSR